MSPKNKGKFGKGKPVVEVKDEFISTAEKVSHRLSPHAKKIFLFLGVVLAGVGAWALYSHFKRTRSERATLEYSEAITASRHEVEAPPPVDQDAGVEPTPEPEPDELARKKITYTSEDERNRAVVAALEDVDSSAAIAGQARLIKAASLLRLGELDQAIDAYRAYNGPAEMAWLAREGVAYAMEGKATAEKDATARETGLRAALEEFRNVQTEAGKPGHDVALWHEARLLAQLGDKAQAITAFEKLRDLDPPSPLKSNAEGRLAMLQASKVAGPAPAPAAPANPQ